MKALRTAARNITRLQFSADNAALIVIEGGDSLPVRERWNQDTLSAMFLIDTSNGEELRHRRLPPETYAVCPVSGRAARFARHKPTGQVRIEIFGPWGRKVHASYPVERPYGRGLMFTSDGKHVFQLSRPSWINLETGHREAVNFPTDWVCSSPCGRYVALGHHLCGVTIWCGGKKVKGCDICADGGMAWSSRGRLAWLRGADLYFGHFERDDVTSAVAVDSTRELPILAFHPDGQVLFTGGGDGSVRAWDSPHGECLREYAWDIGPITALAFSPDGLTCAAGGENGQIVIWDVDI